jgi:hypothetical protein
MLKLRGVSLNNLILVLLIFSSSVFSSEILVKKSMQDYLEVFDAHKVEKIENVFSKKYLKDLGGKKQFSENIKKLEKSDSKYTIEVKKTLKKNIFKARYVEGSETSKWFLFKKEDKKFKVFGSYEE